MEQKKLQAAIEAILFAMGGSVELKKLAQAIGHDEETTKKIIRQMMDRYEKEDRGIRIIELEASFQMCTKKEMYEYLIRVAKQPKKQVLTDVLLETLSIIAYKQPVTKLEIEKIRGVKSDHAVSKLVEYDLVEEVGRMDAPGKPLLFGTTEEKGKRTNISGRADPGLLSSDCSKWSVSGFVCICGGRTDKNRIRGEYSRTVIRPVGSFDGCRQRAYFVCKKCRNRASYGEYNQDHDLHSCIGTCRPG